MCQESQEKENLWAEEEVKDFENVQRMHKQIGINKKISGKTRFQFCMRKPRCKGINDRKQISRLTNFSSLDFREIVKTRALNTVSFYEGIVCFEYTLSR